MSDTGDSKAENATLAMALRLKHGIHTFFLLVNPTSPFSAVTKELLAMARASCPNGLSLTLPPPTDDLDIPLPGEPEPPKPSTDGNTPLPATEEEEKEYVVDYGALKNVDDYEEGWVDIDTQDDAAIISSVVKDGQVLAFMPRQATEKKSKEFKVDWMQIPTAEEEEGDDSLIEGDTLIAG